jgi:acyl carrier protein
MNVPAGIDEDLYDRVLVIVAKNRGRKKTDIRAESRLLQDLGTDGMDADDLLAALGDAFDIDFSGFVFNRHFGPEGWNPLELLQGLFEPETRKKIPITVMDLYEAAKTRKFPDLSDRKPE